MTEIKVSQRAREAAADRFDAAFGPSDLSREMRQGLHDCDPMIQAFARFEQAIRADERERSNFQQRVRPWMLDCFNEKIAADKLERTDRAVEEMLELSQAVCALIGVDFAPRAHALVDYVAGRPIGEIPQEVGGVMVTLAALCLAVGTDMHEAGEIELARINRPSVIEKIRVKHAAKPTGSALPIAIRAQGDEA